MIKDALKNKDFKFAQKAALSMCYEKNLIEELFNGWLLEVKEEEKDLLLIRFALTKIALNKTA